MKAGAQERDRGQVRPDEGQGQPWHPELRRPAYRCEGPQEAPQDRHAPGRVQTARHRPERPLGSSDHGNPVQLSHRPPQGTRRRFLCHLPGLRRGLHGRRHVRRGGRGSRGLPGGGTRGTHRAARGHSGAEPGQGPAGGGSRRGAGRQGGALRGLARRAAVQQRLRGGHGRPGERGSPHAQPPAMPPRSAGWRKPWPASGSVWWSPWKRPLDYRLLSGSRIGWRSARQRVDLLLFRGVKRPNRTTAVAVPFRVDYDISGPRISASIRSAIF